MDNSISVQRGCVILQRYKCRRKMADEAEAAGRVQG
jgi:hypothetical protein